MTAVRYVTERQMHQRTGMRGALGYAFPEEDEILLRKGLPKAVEKKVREHEFEHIKKGEEGPFLKELISAGASILGGALGSRSSSKAADAQAAASREAIAFQRESRDLALGLQKPYRDASYRATAALMDLAGLDRGTPTSQPSAPAGSPSFDLQAIMNTGGSGYGIFGNVVNAYQAYQAGQPNAETSEAPNLADYSPYEFKTDPGYEFRMNEGMRALERGAAARGGLLSGGFARKALRYAQDYASNEYQNVYNRIASIAGFGQVATNNSANIITGTGANVGNAMINAGEARASGYMASGNAWANAINEIAKIDWPNAFGGQNGT